MDDLIRSLFEPAARNLENESKWSYEDNLDQILEAIKHHCQENSVSEYMLHQLSRMLFQGYIVIGEMIFSSPIRSIYETMEAISQSDDSRGTLKNVSRKVGFNVKHSHFAQSSCIEENWINHARKTKLSTQAPSSEVIYGSLISSLSKEKKTGEWVVFSQSSSGLKFWCIWSHAAGDENLISVIKSQCT
jgi:hypothetical protein